MANFTSPKGRLLLRTPEFSDIANIIARVQDPDCVAYLPHLKSANITFESTRERVAQWRKSAGKNSLFLIIELVTDGSVIGDGGFEKLDLEAKTGEAGIMLNSDSSVRGKGYAVEALEGIFAYGFQELGLEKAVLRTLEGNVPMKQLLEKQMGLQPDYRDVEAGTECVFTLTRETWEDRRG